MSNSITTGPWELRKSTKNYFFIDAQHGDGNTTIAIFKEGEVSEADANLMANAPALVDSLQEILAPFELMVKNLPVEQHADALQRINKAKLTLSEALGK